MELYCTEDYIMDDGDIAFVKGKVYDAIIELDVEDNTLYYMFYHNELNYSSHKIGEDDIKKYFTNSFKFGR